MGCALLKEEKCSQMAFRNVLYSTRRSVLGVVPLISLEPVINCNTAGYQLGSENCSIEKLSLELKIA